MTDETRFSVLVSLDEGLNWKLHRGIIASSTEQACKRVRDTHYNSGGTDAEALFYATQAFRPRRMVPKKVTKLTMQQVELPDGVETKGVQPPDGATMMTAADPMPHEPQPGDSSVAPGEFEH